MALHDFFKHKTQDQVEVFRARFDDRDDDEAAGCQCWRERRGGAKPQP